jgi:hypothetical protein
LANIRSIGLMGSHRSQNRDGAQIRRVGRQVEEAGTGGEDGLAPAFDLVGSQIVENHDVARLQRRCQDVLDPPVPLGGPEDRLPGGRSGR